MKVEDVQVGSTITNGSSALRIIELVTKDKTWGTAGVRGMDISLERFGRNTGQSAFIPNYLLGSWRHVPFEWSPCVGGEVEERYVWSSGYRWLQREVRKAPNVMPTVDGIRGHRVISAEESEMARRYALETKPITREDVERLMTWVSAR